MATFINADSPGRRTVAAALRVMGLDQEPAFTNYHRVSNRNRWCSRRIAGCLLRQLIRAFAPDCPVILGFGDTLERRWGARSRPAIYRDPVRSSHGHFVNDSRRRWLTVMLLPNVPSAGRVWGLPFLTILAPSPHYALERRRRHKELTD